MGDRVYFLKGGSVGSPLDDSGGFVGYDLLDAKGSPVKRAVHMCAPGVVKHQKGDFEVDRDNFFMSIKKQVKDLRDRGYFVKISCQHQDTGFSYGHILDAFWVDDPSDESQFPPYLPRGEVDRIDTAGMWAWTELQHELASAVVNGKVQDWSPGLSFDFQDKHTEKTYDVALRELAFVTVGHQSNIQSRNEDYYSYELGSNYVQLESDMPQDEEDKEQKDLQPEDGGAEKAVEMLGEAITSLQAVFEALRGEPAEGEGEEGEGEGEDDGPDAGGEDPEAELEDGGDVINFNLSSEPTPDGDAGRGDVEEENEKLKRRIAFLEAKDTKRALADAGIEDEETIEKLVELRSNDPVAYADAMTQLPAAGQKTTTNEAPEKGTVGLSAPTLDNRELTDSDYRNSRELQDKVKDAGYDPFSPDGIQYAEDNLGVDFSQE